MSTVGAEFSIADLSDLWEGVRTTLESETGMDLRNERRERLTDALRSLARDLRLDSLSAVKRHFAEPTLRPLAIERMVSYLTVGETYFFRNEDHFRALREVVVPAVVQDRRDARLMRCWSAGCASGEEPYSLAILLDRDFPHLNDWDVRILATDISPVFLERAAAGRYRKWSFRQTGVSEDPRYFRKDGDTFVVTDRPRSRVRFQPLNLVRDVYPSPLSQTTGLDLILFRNVAIYLRPAVTRQIIQRFAHCLRPGGWLLLGEIEFSRQLFDDRTFDVVPNGPTFLVRRRTDVPVVALPTPPILKPTISDPAFGYAPAATSSGASPPEPTRAGTTIGQPVAAGAPTEDADPLDAAKAALAVGRVGEATTRLQAMLDRDSLQLEPYLLLASLREEAGDLREAERHLRRALYLDRNCLMAHLLLGLLLRRRGSSASETVFRVAQEIAARRAPGDEVEFGDGMNVGRLRQILELAKSAEHEAAA